MKGLRFISRIAVSLFLLLIIMVGGAQSMDSTPEIWTEFWSEDKDVEWVVTQQSLVDTMFNIEEIKDPEGTYTPQVGQEGKDVVWVPTQQLLVETMLNMAKVTASDYVIDLGAGDGRIVIAAAKRGATALGIEYNLDMVELSRRIADQEGVTERAKFEKADIFESDFSQATVITMFLLPELNLQLRPKILDMRPGTRIVSNSFDMGEWEPDETRTVTENSISGYDTAFLWIVPAKVNGTWQFDNGKINFIQEFQDVTGILTIMGEDVNLVGKLDGRKINFIAGDNEYIGFVSSDTITVTSDKGDFWKATR